MSCTPKRLAAFSFQFGSGPADIAEIAVAEGHQLIAHTDTSSPLRHDLTQAGEHRTARRTDRRLLLGPWAGYRCRHASRAQRQMKLLTSLRHGHDRSIAVVSHHHHSDRKRCSPRHRLSLSAGSKISRAVAQETLQSLARSRCDCGSAGISLATRTVGSRNTKNSCSAVISLSRCREASILDAPLSERTRDSGHHSAHRAYHPLVLDRRNRSVVRPQSQTGMGR